MAGQFDKFTEHARKALSSAQLEAQYFRHDYIGPEHLLLGLLRGGEGLALRVLRNLDVRLGDIRPAVSVLIGQSQAEAGSETSLTSSAKRVVTQAVDEARQFGHAYIGTEHLLLGLLREEETIAHSVLTRLGVTLEEARAETLRLLSQ